LEEASSMSLLASIMTNDVPDVNVASWLCRTVDAQKVAKIKQENPKVVSSTFLRVLCGLLF
jgi:hypothetical protein